jgi:plastocyanin
MKVPVTVFGFAAMFIIAIAGQPSSNPAVPAQNITAQGCLVSSHGDLLLKEDPPGRSYQLRGDTRALQGEIGKEIKVEGEEQPSDQNNPSLQVTRWKQIGDCKAAVTSLGRRNQSGAQPGEPNVAIAGKSGQAATEVPDTNTSSAGQPTPPVDIDRSRMKTAPPAPAGAPPVPEQAGQNPQSADRMAVAASRAEIAAGGGTVGIEGNGSSNSGSNSHTSSAPVPSSVSGHMVRMLENRYAPESVTIRRGQTITWTNNTQSPHTVVLSPEAATNSSDAAMPENAQPFDSGNISPGGHFSHTFSVPGTYKYFCTLHEGNGMVGTIVVRP